MATNPLKVYWKEARGQLKQQWGKLSDDDLRVIDGDIDKLLAALEKNYSYTKAQAMAKVKEFKDNFRKNGNLHDFDTSHDSDPTDMESAGRSSYEKGNGKDIFKDVYKETKEAAEHLKKDVQEYRKTVVDFIEKKPYQSLAIAALGGLVLGFLFKKK